MMSTRVSSQSKEMSELKAHFGKLREDVIAKLQECHNCIESVERLNQEAELLVRNLEDSLANASNDAKEWQEIKIKLVPTTIKGKVILDVGGDKYTTSVETLTREKDTFFTALFSHRWEIERDPKDDSIFIDRDGKLFAYILAYLRTDCVSNEIMTDEILRQNLVLEAKYFHLHKLIKILTEPDRIKRDGTLLTAEQKKKLSEFCGNDQLKWELLYKASRDGFDANTFHNQCDNKGPTVTIIQSANDYLFGGYTSIAWTRPGNCTTDPKSFLFTLTNPYNIPPTKYLIHPCNRQGHIIASSSIYVEPTFKYGNDLNVCSNSNLVDSSYIGFPTNYTDTTGQGNNTFTGSCNFLTSDIEVFKLI